MRSEATAQAASGLPPAFPARAPPLSSKGLKYINFIGGGGCRVTLTERKCPTTIDAVWVREKPRQAHIGGRVHYLA